MFAFLEGNIVHLEDESVIVNVNGVGYLVNISSNTCVDKNVGDAIVLYIQTLVREDAINLYGFISMEQKRLFNLLITVQGVGAKIALIMLAKIKLAEMQNIILLEDVNRLKEIPGVGVKMAQRLINELKDKITKIASFEESSSQGVGISNNIGENININMKEAMLALQGLGYSSFEINKAMQQIKNEINEHSKIEDIITAVLKFFAQGL